MIGTILPAHDADTIALNFGVFIAEQARTHRVSQSAIIAALRPIITPSQPAPQVVPAPAVAPADATAEEVPPVASSADHSDACAHDPDGQHFVGCGCDDIEDEPSEQSPAAPAKRARTKGRGKVVEASIRGNPDWTDRMHAEHLGVGSAYIRRVAARLGLKLASRRSHHKDRQAATTEALKARVAPKKAPPATSAVTGKRLSTKQKVADIHAQHPDWSAPRIAEGLGARLSTVARALADARAAAGDLAGEPIPPANPQKPVAPPPTGEGRTLTERVNAMHMQHPTWTARLIAKELGANPNSVSALLAGARNPRAAHVMDETQQFTGRRQMVEHYGEIAKRLGKPS